MGRLFSGLPTATTQVSLHAASECGSGRMLIDRILGVSYPDILAYRLYRTPICVFDSAIHSHAVYDDRTCYVYAQLPFLNEFHHTLSSRPHYRVYFYLSTCMRHR